MFRTLCGVAVATVMFGGVANSTEHVIEMVNRSENGKPMQYVPAFLKIEPGDTVTFKSIKPGHNVVSIDGMLPDGVAPFKSRLSKDFTMTFEEPGLYGYKCAPHYALGMVGLIQVGDAPGNLETAQAVRHRGKAKAAFDALLAQVDG